MLTKPIIIIDEIIEFLSDITLLFSIKCINCNYKLIQCILIINIVNKTFVFNQFTFYPLDFFYLPVKYVFELFYHKDIKFIKVTFDSFA